MTQSHNNHNNLHPYQTEKCIRKDPKSLTIKDLQILSLPKTSVTLVIIHNIIGNNKVIIGNIH